MSDTAVTYTGAGKIEGKTFTCKRCKRVYAYPVENGRPIRCECGWWYRNDHGKIVEQYKQRIDPVGGSESYRDFSSR